MKRTGAFILFLCMLCQITIFAYAKTEEQNNILYDKLMDIVVFKDGELTALNSGEIQETGGKVFFEDGIPYVPKEYLDKAKIKSDIKENGYAVPQASYVFEDLCFVSKTEAEADFCVEYAHIITRLFGVYIDQNNTESSDGTLNKPYNSIKSAIANLRKLKNDAGLPKGEFPVYIRGGNYQLPSAIELTGEDSGTEETQIVYKSYPGESVSFQGGITIQGKQFNKITDEKTLSRLPENARGKVYCYDLNKSDITAFGKAIYDTSINPIRISLVCGEEKGIIARHPNVGFMQTGKMLKANGPSEDPGFEFISDGKRIDTWGLADNAWGYGVWTWEWAPSMHRITKINPDERIIGTSENHMYVPSEGRDWYIYNLLEELDMPNEFFLDKISHKLYFYPNAETVKSGEFQNIDIKLTVSQGDLIKGNGVQYVTFKDITFENVGNNAVTFKDAYKCNFLGCIVKNIGNNGIDIVGEYCKVHGCDIYNIAQIGVCVDGGDRDKLVSGGNEITNNRIFKCNAIRAYGVGTYIANNELFSANSMIFAHAYSNDTITEYNEIYDAMQGKLNDFGAWYYNVDPTFFGNVYRYNYFHDVNYGMGIFYLDDGLCGAEIYGNLFYNMNRAAFLHGAQYSKIYDNIILNSNNSGFYVQQLTHDVRWDPETLTPVEGSSEKSQHYLWRLTENQRRSLIPYTNEVWMNKYPQVSEVMKSGQSYLPYHNEIYHNIQISPNGSKAVEKSSIVGDDIIDISDNYSAKDEDLGFYNVEEFDFRIKDDARIYEIYPDIKPIDFEKVGIYVDDVRTEMPKLQKFSLAYPENMQENIDATSVDFSWDSSIGTDKYRFILATDSEFKNIIKDEEVIGNKVTVKNLRFGKKKYYWKVIALSNHSKSLGNVQLPCNQEYFSFTTLEEPIVDTEKADLIMNEMENLSATMVEGTNRGQYFKGTKAKLDQLIADYKILFNQKGISQNKLNSYVEQFTAETDKIKGMRAIEYQTFKDLFVQNYWSMAVNTVTFDTKNEGFTWRSDGTNTFAGYAQRKLQPYEAVKLNMTFDIDDGWQGIAMRADGTTTACWAGNKQYIVIIKKDIIEFQFYKPNGSHILIEYPNNYIKSGVEYLIDFSVKNMEDGSVHIEFLVDDEKVFEYDDKENPIIKPGYLQLYNMASGKLLSVRPIDEEPEDTNTTKPEASTDVPVHPGQDSSAGLLPAPEGLSEELEELTDLDTAPWAAEQINYLYESRVVSGKGEGIFAPNDEITREEFIRLVVNAFIITGESDVKFNDVSENAWYESAVKSAYGSSIINGISEEEFGVGQKITREDMAVILHRALNKKGVKLNASEKYNHFFNFDDADRISDYAKDAVKSMYLNKVISGVTEDLMSPKQNATRAMAAMMIYRALNLL